MRGWACLADPPDLQLLLPRRPPHRRVHQRPPADQVGRGGPRTDRPSRRRDHGWRLPADRRQHVRRPPGDVADHAAEDAGPTAARATSAPAAARSGPRSRRAPTSSTPSRAPSGFRRLARRRDRGGDPLRAAAADGDGLHEPAERNPAGHLLQEVTSRRMARSRKALVGAHVSPRKPLEKAAAIGADCAQIFLSDPQGWKKPPARRDAAELRDSPMPLYVHAPYLINVCSPRNNVRYGSRKILQQTCEAAVDVGAAAVIVHAGHAEDEIGEGLGRWLRTLEMLESEVPVSDREHRRRRERGRPALRCARPPLGRGREGELRGRDRILLRHLPRPCRRGAARKCGRAPARDRG